MRGINWLQNTAANGETTMKQNIGQTKRKRREKPSGGRHLVHQQLSWRRHALHAYVDLCVDARSNVIYIYR